MPRAHYELAARVVKARGLEGEVTATGAGDLPLLLREGDAAFVVPPSLYGPRRLTVEGIRPLGAGSFALSFAEVTSIGDAEQLAGRYLLVEDDGQAGDVPQVALLDREVVDGRLGPLGRAVEYLETPANDVLVVQGGFGEVLVPLVEDVVVEVPEDEALPVRVALLEGLVDDAGEGSR